MQNLRGAVTDVIEGRSRLCRSPQGSWPWWWRGERGGRGGGGLGLGFGRWADFTDEFPITSPMTDARMALGGCTHRGGFAAMHRSIMLLVRPLSLWK